MSGGKGEQPATVLGERTAFDDLWRRTASGVVSGRRDGEAVAFLGIPYAAPPVGGARFAAPRAPVAWSGVREATVFGPSAPQTPLATPSAAPGTGGEDWLTLNVWTTPDALGQALPVMVWVHGGAFLMGTAAEPDYNGRRLSAETGAVVVTLNFRVGVEGFAQIAGAPANRGLLDVVAALEWIAQNIGEFGGDPARVTVLGQSAGASMVAALLAMPNAAGLFHRAVIQSPPGTTLTSELAADVAEILLGKLGLSATASALAATDPHELAASISPLLKHLRQEASRWGSLAMGAAPFAPVVDGEVLVRNPWEAVAAGDVASMDLIVGHTRDESRFFRLSGGGPPEATGEQAEQMLEKISPWPGAADAYREAFPEATVGQLIEIVQSDATFRMPAIHLAEAQAAVGGRVFVYELTWSTPALGGGLGSCHCLDYGLLFGIRSAGLQAVLTAGVPDDEFETLSADLRRRWVGFAETGDPGWDRYDVGQRQVQLIDLESRVAPYPEERSRRLWSDRPPRPLPLLA